MPRLAAIEQDHLKQLQAQAPMRYLLLFIASIATSPCALGNEATSEWCSGLAINPKISPARKGVVRAILEDMGYPDNCPLGIRKAETAEKVVISLHEGALKCERDLEPLSVLKNATELHLKLLCSIRSLEPLGRLKRLSQLSLSSSNPFTDRDFEALQHLVDLETLSLWGIKTTTLAPLRDMTKLEALDISKSEIDDWTHLAALQSLQRLEIYKSNLSSLEPIADLTKLYQLRIKHCQISELPTLTKLRKLEVLSLEGNRIRDVRPLSSLKQTSLNIDLTGNPISKQHCPADPKTPEGLREICAKYAPQSESSK